MPGLNLPMLCSEFVNKDIKFGEKTKTVIVVTKSWLVDSGHVYQTHAALNTTSLTGYLQWLCIISARTASRLVGLFLLFRTQSLYYNDLLSI